MNFVSCEFKNSSGELKYTMSGKYLEKLVAKNVDTSETWTEYENYKFPSLYQDKTKIFGMNLFALQMNYLPPSLQEKLPPTDSRLRPDIRAWENGQIDLAQEMLDKMADNQRKRRAQLKEKFKEEGKEFDPKDERKWYNS
jgi:hypothetical protein